MIPTMIVFGLLLGRWWKPALIVGTSAWTVLLWSQGLLATPPEIVGAAALALVNTAVGVLVHQLMLAFMRRARGHSATPVEGTATTRPSSGFRQRHLRPILAVPSAASASPVEEHGSAPQPGSTASGPSKTHGGERPRDPSDDRFG